MMQLNIDARWKAVTILCVVTGVTACSGEMSQSYPLGQYEITVRTDPSPPEVGEDAEVTVHVKNTDQALNACQMHFRQFMPEHEMTADETWYAMERVGKDMFRARGGEFNMGGDWELELKLSCGGDIKLVSVPYMLEWPE